MDREFLDEYNRELQLLYEHAREFSEIYPGIADRLGGLLRERMDPMISGLLEGTAFLAARVQLKLKHEFPEFTANLLEQLVPNYLAPTPSFMLVSVTPPFGDPALSEGRTFARHTILDATFDGFGREISCRYRLTAPIVLWPFEIVGVQYLASASPLPALGLSIDRNVLSGLRVTLTRRSSARLQDEMPDKMSAQDPSTWFSTCTTQELTFYVKSAEADAVALYEQIFAHAVDVHFRYLDSLGDPVVIRVPRACLSQIGLEENALFPLDDRVFSGFDLLREYFAFPQKFLGFRISGLDRILPKVAARTLDIVITFSEVNASLAASIEKDSLALCAAPAINLFEKTLDRIPVSRNQHEYHVIPDRNHYLEYEPHRIIDVFAYYRGGRDKARVYPLYSATWDDVSNPDLFYTIRRLPRRRSDHERRQAQISAYTGTDVFLSLGDKSGIDDDDHIAELGLRALCSNRHLTEYLPVGRSGADIAFLEAADIQVACVAGPTPPREPLIGQIRARSEVASTGIVTWRLVNMLSLNHLGLVERGAGGNAQALCEVLSMFADLSDSAMERRIRGIKSVNSRPVVRRMRQSGGVGAARGIEVTVTIDEKAFEGTGSFLLGAILDRFYAEYASLNHFTQTVIRSLERGEIMRWPVRAGMRRLA